MQTLKFAVHIEPHGRGLPALGVDAAAVPTGGRNFADGRGLTLCAPVKSTVIQGPAGG
jgi:hypothetical protein